MGNTSKHTRGQALIIIAFAIIGLVGITGLTVDGGLVFSDRRHAQNAADTAAIAGAMAMLHEIEDGNVNHDAGGGKDGYYAHVVVAARNLAAINGYSGDLVSSEIEVWTCDMEESSCGYYAGDAEFVQVIIYSHINTLFARVIGITQMHNTVKAIAMADDDDSGPVFGGKSIIALSSGCESPDNFMIQGSADVTIEGGGLFVNTTDPECGFKCDTNGGSITSDITTAGGAIDISSKCNSAIEGELSDGASPFPFPVELEDMGLAVPEECTSPAGTFQNFASGYTYGEYPPITGPVTVLTPGRYSDFPPKGTKNGKPYDRLYMQPGVYCVEDGVKLTTSGLEVYGYDVTFFVPAGEAFDITGGLIQVDAPNAGPYAGYLMIVEPDYDAAPTNCSITGNTSNVFTGGIFAPYCNLTINGGSKPTAYETQIMAYTIKMNGTSTIYFTNEAADNPMIQDPAKTGIIQ